MATSTKPRTRARSNRLAKLVASNDPPLEGELQTFRESIAETQTRLSDVDEEIAQLRASLDSRLLVRGQLQARIQDLEVVTTPIRRVPADVLSVIFGFCVYRVDVKSLSDLPYDSLNVKEGPWLLGQVCHLWRSVVGALAGLWSSVNIMFYTQSRFYSDKQRSIGHSRHLLGRLIRNTKKAPLSVGLHGLEEVPDYLALLHEITKRSERWENLRVLLEDRGTPQSLQYLSCVKGRLSALEFLHIYGQDIHAHEGNIPCDTFSLAPQLRELDVTCMSNPTRLFSLPWSQITRYSWSSWGTGASDDHFVIIQQMPNLEECRLECKASEVQESTSRPMIQLLCLRRLDLEEAYGTGAYQAVGETLSWLHAPALQSLKIRGHFVDSGFVSLREFLVRSTCPLTDLYLGFGKHMSHQELTEILRCVPSLEKLYLEKGLLGSLATGLFSELKCPTNIHLCASLSPPGYIPSVLIDSNPRTLTLNSFLK